MKETVCAIVGAVGGAVAALLGGWDQYMIVLLTLMVLDYVTGSLVALVWHRSPKTATGGANSRIGFKGLVKKVLVIVMVVVANLIDYLVGTDYIRNAVTIAFCTNEILSIAENYGLAGLPMPAALKKAIDVLTQTADQAGGGHHE